MEGWLTFVLLILIVITFVILFFQVYYIRWLNSRIEQTGIDQTADTQADLTLALQRCLRTFTVRVDAKVTRALGALPPPAMGENMRMACGTKWVHYNPDDVLFMAIARTGDGSQDAEPLANAVLSQQVRYIVVGGNVYRIMAGESLTKAAKDGHVRGLENCLIFAIAPAFNISVPESEGACLGVRYMLPVGNAAEQPSPTRQMAGIFDQSTDVYIHMWAFGRAP